MLKILFTYPEVSWCLWIVWQSMAFLFTLHVISRATAVCVTASPLSSQVSWSFSAKFCSCLRPVTASALATVLCKARSPISLDREAPQILLSTAFSTESSGLTRAGRHILLYLKNIIGPAISLNFLHSRCTGNFRQLCYPEAELSMTGRYFDWSPSCLSFIVTICRPMFLAMDQLEGKSSSLTFPWLREKTQVWWLTNWSHWEKPAARSSSMSFHLTTCLRPNCWHGMARDQIVPQKTGLWLSHRQAIGRQDFSLEQTEMLVVSWHYCLSALLCVASSIAAPSRTRPSIFLNLSVTCTIITKNPKSINRLNSLPQINCPLSLCLRAGDIAAGSGKIKAELSISKEETEFV